MSALVADIAQAVTDALNLEAEGPPPGFSMPFTAERKALPDFDLHQMGDLHVTVVPRSDEISALSRNSDAHEVAVDVGVQKKLITETNAEIDPLLSLVQEIADFLNRRAMSGAAGSEPFAWRGTANDPICLPEHIREMRQFTSVLTVTYRATRTPSAAQATGTGT